MNFKIITLLTSLCISTISVMAQTPKGRVINEENTPIAYVNIGIPGKQIGTVSDDKGVFNLDLSSLSSTDTLKFSCIGYESKGYINGLVPQPPLSNLNSNFKRHLRVESKKNSSFE